MGRKLDIGVTAWSPLGGGVLSGKYNIDNTDEEKRYNVANPMSSSFINEKNKFIATELQKIAREIDKTPSQVALNWIMQNEQYRPIIPIIGARTAVQAVDNLHCAEFQLTSDQLK
jgi:aryl-alcohol dehydrogenase-like predicted oxidoreductase